MHVLKFIYKIISFAKETKSFGKKYNMRYMGCEWWALIEIIKGSEPNLKKIGPKINLGSMGGGRWACPILIKLYFILN